MVTRDSPYLTTDILLHAEVKKKFPLLPLVWYLFNVVSANGQECRGTNGNALSITIPLVMHLLLDMLDGYYLW